MRLIAFIFVTVLMAAPARAEWRLNPDLSHLSFGSEKKGAVGEVHHFSDLAGEVDATGRFSLVINLASLETWIDIRNQRMLEFLFEVVDFPTARLTGAIDLAAFDGLAVGGVAEENLVASLSLHGHEQELDVFVTVARLADNRVLVVPYELIFLNAAEFGLDGGVAKLAELADLPSISRAVPVTFHLVFER